MGKQLAAILRDRLGVLVKVGTGNKTYVYMDKDLLRALKHTNLTNSEVIGLGCELVLWNKGKKGMIPPLHKIKLDGLVYKGG